MHNIICKVLVLCSKSTSNKIAFTVSSFNKFFCTGNYSVIAAVSCIVMANFIMNFFSSVNADNDIVHILIYEVNSFLIHQSTISGCRKPKMLTGTFFKASSICNRFFYNIKINHRFSAEKIYFNV